jgi:hypothetical protein
LNSLSFYNATIGTDAFYCSGAACPSSVWSGGDGYYINATIPANTPGGRYIVNLNLTYDHSNYSYVGNSIFNHSLFINNTGLYMTTNTSESISMANKTTRRFYVNITNYGALDASSATIRFSESCSGYSVSGAAANKIGNCTINSYSDTTDTYTFTLPAFDSNCTVWWTITAGSSAASVCTGNIIGNSKTWFDARAINVSITVTKASSTVSTPTGPSGSTGTTTTTVPTANLAFTEVPTLAIVKQNSTNTTSVQVKNTGTVSQTINFTVEDIDSDWWSTNSTSATLASGVSAGFRVTFTVGNVDIKDYSPSFKATSPNKTN